MITNAIRTSARQTAASMFMAVALLAAPFVASDASAQGVASAGRGSARLNLQASLTVGYRMKVRQSEPARIVKRDAESTEVEVPVTAASNVRWTLSVANRSGAGAAEKDIEVLDVNGNWRSLKDGSTAAVFSGANPTNGQPVTVRVRLAPGADLDTLGTVRFVMMPSGR